MMMNRDIRPKAPGQIATVRLAEELSVLQYMYKEFGFVRFGDEQVCKSAYLTAQADLKDNIKCRRKWTAHWQQR